MAKKSDNGKKGKQRETRTERQARLQDRDEIDITRREERLAVGLEGQLAAATADWE